MSRTSPPLEASSSAPHTSPFPPLPGTLEQVITIHDNTEIPTRSEENFELVTFTSSASVTTALSKLGPEDEQPILHRPSWQKVEGEEATPETPPARPRYCACILSTLKFAKRHWFLLTLPFSILLAYLIPQGGPLHTEYTVKYAAVMIIFFFSGLGLEGSILKAFWTHWKVHLVIQIISFGLLPLLGYACSKILLLYPLMDINLANGFSVALSMPTTISSNVIMTAEAKGNSAVSLINATLGNLLGIVLSPLLVKMYLGSMVDLNFGKIMLDMTITVVVPLILGQLLRYIFLRFQVRGFSRIPMSTISSCMLLLMVFSTFSNTFANPSPISFLPFLFIVLFILLLLPFAMCFCFVLGKALFYPREVVATVYCGSTKTLSLGIPILTLLFPSQAETTVPLLLYHAAQLFLGGAVAGRLAKWVETHPLSSASLG